MAIYTNTMRFTGLSGVDTDAMVNSLMKAEGMKLDKLYRNKQKLEWKQTAYRTVASSLNAFKNTWFDIAKSNNALSRSTYVGNSVSVTSSKTSQASSAARVSTASTASPGTYTLTIDKLATKDAYTGTTIQGELKSGVVDPTQIKANDSINFTLDGTTKVLTFTEADVGAINAATGKSAQLESLMNDKLKAAFGMEKVNGVDTAKAQVRLNGDGTMTYTTTPGHTLKVAGGGSRTEGTNRTGNSVMPVGEKKLAADSLAVKKYSLLVSSGANPAKTINFELKADMSDGDIAKAVNDAISKEKISGLSASVTDGKVKFSASGTSEDITITAKDTSMGTLGNLGFSDSTITLGRTSMLPSFGLKSGATTALGTGSKLSDALGVTGPGAFVINGTEIKYSETDTIKQLMDRVNSSQAGVTMSYNAISEAFTLESKNTGSVNAIKFGAGADFLSDKLGLAISSVQGDAGAVAAETALSTTLSDAFSMSTGGAFTINGTVINYETTDTIKDLVDRVNTSSAGVTLNYNAEDGSFSMTGGSFDFEDTSGFLANNLKLDVTDVRNTSYTQAIDARFSVNGREFTRDSNNVDIGDLKITLNAATAEDEDLTIVVEKDITKTMDYIKEFVTAYNTLIADLNKQTSTNRAKSGTRTYYEPLTDEEKEAMSETQIEQWEEKAKQGLLYNDDIVKGITSSMRSMLYQSVDLGDGKKISMYEIGISTSSNYWEGGKLVIDEDKLRQALETRGEDVADLFTKRATKAYVSGSKNTERLNQEGLADRLDDIIKMATDSKSSIALKAGIEGTYSAGDNALYKQLKDESNRISDMLKYLQNRESYYFSMFSKMEQAMNSSNSQMAYLQAQMGS